MILSNLITNLNTNILLQGQEGLFMLEDAQEFISFLFKGSSYEKHPDYLYVDLPKDKKTIGVDEIKPIIEKSLVKPVLFEKNLVLINHMECLTEAAQNKLLLSLEESPYLFLIGISYKERLLDTVLSRMRKITYEPLSEKDFISYCGNTYTEKDATLLWYACGGCPALLNSMGEHLSLFRNLNACQNNRSAILSLLHLVKEKDKLAIHEERSLLRPIFRVMEYTFLEASYQYRQNGDDGLAYSYAEIVERLLLDESKLDFPSYTKDNLFETMIFCIEH